MVARHAVQPTVREWLRAARSSRRTLIQILSRLSLLLLFSPVCVNAAAPADTGFDTHLSQVPTTERMLATPAPPARKDLALGRRPLEFEGSLELIREEMKSVAFGQRPKDDLRTSKQEIQLQLSYRASERLSALGEIKWQAEQQVFADETPPRSEKEIERGETWLHWQRLFDRDASVKIGRQNFAEPRRWWWDDDLDALRFDYARDSWNLTLGVAEELARKSSQENFIDPRDEDVLRLLGHASWKLSSARQFSAFYLRQRDDSVRQPVNSLVETTRADKSDADLQWIGLRAAGDIDLSPGGTVTYWFDAATVSGNETAFEHRNEVGGMSRVVSRQQQRVRGHAADLGLIWKPAAVRAPTLTLSHARGSGDKNLNDDIDRAFRQTGLQDPTQEFRYYGELLRPELSNLSITTATIGFAVTAGTRLTLGYHRFRQVYPAAFLRDARIDLRPTGQDNDVGREISLLVEMREWEDLKVVVAAASFEAGDAFGAAAGKRANSLFFELTYEF